MILRFPTGQWLGSTKYIHTVSVIVGHNICTHQNADIARDTARELWERVEDRDDRWQGLAARDQELRRKQSVFYYKYGWSSKSMQGRWGR